MCELNRGDPMAAACNDALRERDELAAKVAELNAQTIAMAHIISVALEWRAAIGTNQRDIAEMKLRDALADLA